MKCNCGGEYKHQFTAVNSDHTHKAYKCVKCQDERVEITYNYNPTNCPKHLWEFIGWGFNDSPWSHEIYWKMKCDRCGATHRRRFDRSEIGIRRAVDLEDPRVLPTLEWTKDTARFHLPDDDVKEFWK